MGLFSSDSTQETTNVTTTDIDEINTSLSKTDGIAIAGNKKKVNIKVVETDQGAVNSAFDAINDTLDTVLDFAGDLAANTFGFSGQTIGQVGAIAAPDVADLVTAPARFQFAGQAETIKTVTRWVAGAGAVAAVAWLVMRKRK